ncbi:uncharacterized protein LOC129859303 isoform X3 [Salvelinus fontinalis]|uniref:uncharacterized protein LOC129859303 isoform X3 n=1 Tax=Salvelinus fontinalis TaxID=8038 RepID=UPI002486A73D|nr:uncharacterized protein LOC129859303 isoform X3 [Salvelinus fontinalis]
METPESDQFKPTQEMQCPSIVGRRSVEMKSVTKEFFCLTGETDQGRVSVSTRGASMRSSHTPGHCQGSESVLRRTVTLDYNDGDDYDDTVGIAEHTTKPEVTEVRRLCRRSEPPFSLFSPTESLQDILYRKTKHVFDYTVTDMKDKKPDVSRWGSNLSQCVRPAPFPVRKGFNVSTSRNSQRREQSIYQMTVIRKDHVGRPLLMLKGNASLTNIDGSNNTDSFAYSSRLTKGKPSTSSQPGSDIRIPPVVTRKHSAIIREERKMHYYKDLCQQVEEKRQQKVRERRRITTAEQTHNETMQFCTWGMPGSGAPNYHLDSVRRNKFSCTGMIPQEQLRCKGFSGIPFHLHVK